jgi:hypothetical protein
MPCGKFELNAHEKEVGQSVVELLGIDDIAARVLQAGCDIGDQAGSVLTLEGQNALLRHH